MREHSRFLHRRPRWITICAFSSTMTASRR
jgi:hypothetical protein